MSQPGWRADDMLRTHHPSQAQRNEEVPLTQRLVQEIANERLCMKFNGFHGD